jgi:hypothetical protein
MATMPWALVVLSHCKTLIQRFQSYFTYIEILRALSDSVYPPHKPTGGAVLSKMGGYMTSSRSLSPHAITWLHNIH